MQEGPAKAKEIIGTMLHKSEKYFSYSMVALLNLIYW